MHVADLDYEAKFREVRYIFPIGTNKVCTTLNIYHDDLKEETEKLVIVAASGGVGQFSASPRSVSIYILDMNGLLDMFYVIYLACDQ